MTESTIVIVDYGVGNLLSVCRAVAHCGATPLLTNDPERIAAADRVILPGVGAFGDCAAALRANGLDQSVQAFAATGRPLLGICVGMQVLFDVSEEYGEHAGLGLIPGRVKAIPAITMDGLPHKTPHIGWSAIRSASDGPADWSGSTLAGVTPGTAMYFVHSFTAWPQNPAHRLADTLYGGQRISAAVRSGNISGTQFHPEKSGPAGLAVLASFLAS